MDPISQGVLGAIAASTVAKTTQIRLAALVGCVGGMLADTDVFISSASDPLLNIEFHRHFSHSLAFIPIGGLITALLFFPFLRRKLSFPPLFLYAVLGYATAGLLDACTSYGTQLLWPFSNARISWSIISIIDPLFTVPLLGLVGWAVFKKSKRPAKYAANFALLYLGFGTVQNQRASSIQSQLITDRGHQTATQATVKPSIANLLLWRSVYLYEGNYYVDAVRAGLFSANKTYSGSQLPAYDTAQAITMLPTESPLVNDLQRFDHFSDGYLAPLPHEPNYITDLRYSAVPNSIAPLWGLNLDDINSAGHAAFETRRNISDSDKEALVKMLKGSDL